ncbi:MAG TPA: putative toxin-antitoxin system toxin component, PIN family [Acidiferrobacterales bacterium]|nr:putative toxin-antitoxin system toxin component, PIN family [Acidiferrobacterales bacterium]
MLDTNCVVSAFLWGGTPRQIIDAAVEGQCQLFTSGALLAELEEVLARGKFRPRFLSAQTSVAQILAEYTGQVTVVHAASISPTITADPDDDQVLACAVTAQADLIVSGDRHLLDLKQYRDIPVATPAEALRRISAA